MRALLLGFAALVIAMLGSMAIGQRYAEFFIRADVQICIVSIVGLAALGSVIVLVRTNRSKGSPKSTDQNP